jgi:hypothetical protein
MSERVCGGIPGTDRRAGPAPRDRRARGRRRHHPRWVHRAVGQVRGIPLAASASHPHGRPHTGPIGVAVLSIGTHPWYPGADGGIREGGTILKGPKGRRPHAGRTPPRADAARADRSPPPPAGRAATEADGGPLAIAAIAPWPTHMDCLHSTTQLALLCAPSPRDIRAMESGWPPPREGTGHGGAGPEGSGPLRHRAVRWKAGAAGRGAIR